MNIMLATKKGELRVDSRLLAHQLDNRHRNVIALVKKHQDHIKRFGHLLFETQVGERGQGGGKAELFVLLNEDQAYFLLSLSKNTERVVTLKANLITAFREARDRASVTSAQYLPLYHALHNEVAALARRAQEGGSTTAAQMFHINANKALNSIMGIAKGERSALSVEQQLILTNLQAIYRNALRLCLKEGDNHRVASAKAKAACQAFMERAGNLLLPQCTVAKLMDEREWSATE